MEAHSQETLPLPSADMMMALDAASMMLPTTPSAAAAHLLEDNENSNSSTGSGSSSSSSSSSSSIDGTSRTAKQARPHTLPPPRVTHALPFFPPHHKQQ